MVAVGKWVVGGVIMLTLRGASVRGAKTRINSKQLPDDDYQKPRGTDERTHRGRTAAPRRPIDQASTYRAAFGSIPRKTDPLSRLRCNVAPSSSSGTA